MSDFTRSPKKRLIRNEWLHAADETAEWCKKMEWKRIKCVTDILINVFIIFYHRIKKSVHSRQELEERNIMAYNEEEYISTQVIYLRQDEEIISEC